MNQYLRHIPNSLTILRFLLALAFPFIEKDLRFPIILISLGTEFLDGFLARIFDWRSKVGALLDPIADKTFVFSASLVVFFESDLSWLELMGIGLRDLIVFWGALKVALRSNWKAFFNVRPRILGKTATTFQFVILIFFLWRSYIPDYLLYGTIGVSFLAGVDYLYLFFKNNFYEDQSIK